MGPARPGDRGAGVRRPGRPAPGTGVPANGPCAGAGTSGIRARTRAVADDVDTARRRAGNAVRLPAAPLIPDGDEAREWAERELADTVYRVAEPTPFDRAARAVGDFFLSLFSGDVPAAFGPWLAVAVLVIVLAAIGVAVAIWGRPRRAARAQAAAALFGDAERRSAADLRRAAEGEAAGGRWEAAIVLRFRALARSLSDRTIVPATPGTTVHGFARSAARAFPGETEALTRAADVFDDVRYLRRPGTPDAYALVASLDERLAAAPRPQRIPA